MDSSGSISNNWTWDESAAPLTRLMSNLMNSMGFECIKSNLFRPGIDRGMWTRQDQDQDRSLTTEDWVNLLFL